MSLTALVAGLLTTGCENPLRGPDLLTISNETDNDVVAIVTSHEQGDANRLPVTSKSVNEVAAHECFAADIAVESVDGETLATLDDQQICPRWILVINADLTLTLRENS